MILDLPFKPPSWMPFGLPRVDRYFMRGYTVTCFMVTAALLALVTIGDIFQKFDNFAVYARDHQMDTVATLTMILTYYAAFVPQLVLEYMLPLIFLLAAAISVTYSCANNEYTVLRAAGISARRAFLPIPMLALLLGVAFLLTRDFFLPGMVRQAYMISQQVKPNAGYPMDITLVNGGQMQSIAIGGFTADGVAHNIILEIRDLEQYQRGDPDQGDNEFRAFVARTAVLEPASGGEGYQWRPLEKAEQQLFGRFIRRAIAWTEPIPTPVTPAMLERQMLGDAVSSWKDLALMRGDNPQADFESHWRLADPVSCFILVIMGAGLAMGRMLRGSQVGYIQSVVTAMIMAAAFYSLRLWGQSLWETGVLSSWQGAWAPIGAGGMLSLVILYWMER